MADFDATPITRRLIVGGGIVGQDEVAWLQANGVTHVISAALELNDASHFHAAGLRFLHIPWVDDGQSKPIADFKRALFAVVAADAAQLANATGALSGLYVHCHLGQHRGPLLATFLLAALDGSNVDEAYARVCAARPVVASFDRPAYRTSCIAALDAITPLSASVAPLARATVAASDVAAPVSVLATPPEGDTDGSAQLPPKRPRRASH